MIERRDLIKKLLYGSVVWSIADLQTFLAEAGALMSMPENASQKQNRAIYCVVDNPELEAALKTFAEEINCEILFDWPNSIELILEHYFIAIVDGSIIDEAVWTMYIEFCNNGDIRVPCLLFGDTGRLQIPEYGNVYRIASNDYVVIMDSIKNIKSGLLTSA